MKVKRISCYLVIIICLFYCVSCRKVDADDLKQENNNSIIVAEDDENIAKDEKDIEEQNKENYDSKYHFAYENKIYFRQYSAEAVLEGNVLGNYSENKTARKYLVSFDKDGRLTKVFEDFGYGSIYISFDKFYSQCIGENGRSNVYSCDLTGENRNIWEAEKILDKSESGFLICKTDSDGLTIINNNREQLLIEDSVKYQGCFNNIIYYSIQRENIVELYSVDVNGIKRKVTEVRVSEVIEKGDYYSEIVEVGNLDVCGEYIAFAAGDYGNDNAYFGGVIVLCKVDGTEKKVFYSETPTNSFICDGSEIALLYGRKEDIQCEVIRGRKEGNYEFLPIYSEINQRNSVIGYIKHTGKKETYLSEQEYKQLLSKIEVTLQYQYDFHEIKNAEIIDNKLFFNIVLEKADSTKDIGWRAYYERVATYEYVKDLETGVIKIIYSY